MCTLSMVRSPQGAGISWHKLPDPFPISLSPSAAGASDTPRDACIIRMCVCVQVRVLGKEVKELEHGNVELKTKLAAAEAFAVVRSATQHL